MVNLSAIINIQKEKLMQSRYDALFEFIKKNTKIPQFFNEIQKEDKKVAQLLTAIQSGKADADIFSDKNCYLYLLYLIKNEKIPFLQGMTVYAYLMALMQFTDKQPLEDKTMKFNRELKVFDLFIGDEISPFGKFFLDRIYTQCKNLHYKIDFDELVKYVSLLPNSERWLLIFKLNDNEDYNNLSDCDRFGRAILYNVPFFIIAKSTVEQGVSYGLIPSCTLIDYVLNKISDYPMKMNFMFGSFKEKTLYTFHENNKHPIALYSPDVKSSLKNADGYSPGPYIIFLHDIGHTFWATMLGKDERQFIFTKFITELKKMMDEANKVNDHEMVEKVQLVIDKVIDFDLTSIFQFINSDRLEKYLVRAIEYSRVFYLAEGVGSNKFGCVEDRLYYLALRLSTETQTKESKRIWGMILSAIKTGPHYRDEKVIESIKSLAISKYTINLFNNKDRYTMHWMRLKEILEDTNDSKSLWEKLDFSKGNNELQPELNVFLSKQGVHFFHPYISWNETQLKEFKKFVDIRVDYITKIKTKNKNSDLKLKGNTFFKKSNGQLIGTSFFALPFVKSASIQETIGDSLKNR